MGFYKDLTDFEKDFLKELCTIGTGNSATSLSMILNKSINIQVPSLDIIYPEQMPENLGEEELPKIVIFSYITGNYLSKFLIIFSAEESKKISHDLLRQDIGNIDLSSPDQQMFTSMLLEVGNIIISSYVNAMSSLIDVKLIQTPPQIKYDLVESIIDQFCIESAEKTNEMLLLKNKFISSGNEILFDIVFIPDEISLKQIFEKFKKG